MRYLLATLSHGDPSKTLDECTRSFLRYVTSLPSQVIGWHDGPGRRATMHGTEEAQGFCSATRSLWRLAASSGEDFVFWLEHDFVFTRDVDLAPLAEILDARENLGFEPVAQMALMRDAVNAEEKAAGGLYELRRDQYHSRGSWLEHEAYFTTNPSLMTTAFMRANPWPDYPSECEGRFGIDLVERGYSFGVWGDGSPWVRHIGERTGFGY